MTDKQVTGAVVTIGESAGLVTAMDHARVVEASIPGLRESAREAIATRELAVREGVDAKGRALALQRENDALRADRTALAQEGDGLRAKVSAHWEALKVERARSAEQNQHIVRLERELSATMARVAATASAPEHTATGEQATQPAEAPR